MFVFRLLIFLLLIMLSNLRLSESNKHHNDHFYAHVLDAHIFAMVKEPKMAMYKVTGVYNYTDVEAIQLFEDAANIQVLLNSFGETDIEKLAESHFSKAVSCLYITYHRRKDYPSLVYNVIRALTQLKKNWLYYSYQQDRTMSDAFEANYGDVFIERISDAMIVLGSMYAGSILGLQQEKMSRVTYYYNPGLNYHKHFSSKRASRTIRPLTVISSEDYPEFFSKLVNDKVFDMDTDYEYTIRLPSLGTITQTVPGMYVRDFFYIAALMAYNLFYGFETGPFVIKFLLNKHIEKIYTFVEEKFHVEETPYGTKDTVVNMAKKDFKKEMIYDHYAFFCDDGPSLDVPMKGSGSLISAYATINSIFRANGDRLTFDQRRAAGKVYDGSVARKNHKLPPFSKIRDLYFRSTPKETFVFDGGINDALWEGSYDTRFVDMFKKGYALGWAMNDRLSDYNFFLPRLANRVFTFSSVYFEEGFHEYIQSNYVRKARRKMVFVGRDESHGLKIVDENSNFSEDIPYLYKFKSIWTLRVGKEDFPVPELDVLRIISALTSSPARYEFGLFPPDVCKQMIPEDDTLRIFRVNTEKLREIRGIVLTKDLPDWNMTTILFDSSDPTTRINGHWLYIDGMYDRSRISTLNFVLIRFWNYAVYTVIDGVDNKLSGLLTGTIGPGRSFAYDDSRKFHHVHENDIHSSTDSQPLIKALEAKVLSISEVVNGINDRLSADINPTEGDSLKLAKIGEWVNKMNRTFKGIEGVQTLKLELDLYHNETEAIANDFETIKMKVVNQSQEVLQMKHQVEGVTETVSDVSMNLNKTAKELHDDIDQVSSAEKEVETNLTIALRDIKALQNRATDVERRTDALEKGKPDLTQYLTLIVYGADKAKGDTIIKEIKEDIKKIQKELQSKDVVTPSPIPTDKPDEEYALLNATVNNLVLWRDAFVKRYPEVLLIRLDALLLKPDLDMVAFNQTEMAENILTMTSRILYDCKVHGSIRVFQVPSPGAFHDHPFAYVSADGVMIINGYDTSRFNISHYPEYAIDNYSFQYKGPVETTKYVAIIKKHASDPLLLNLYMKSEVNFLASTIIYARILPVGEIRLNGLIYINDFGHVGV